MTTSARSAVAVTGTAEAIRASGCVVRTTCASPNRTQPTDNGAAAAAVVSGRGDQEGGKIQTHISHDWHYTYSLNDAHP
jgi:hypothetical protein